MSFEAQAWAAKITLGSSSKKAVLALLANSANEDGYCWPSIGYIQRVTELGRNTVLRALSALEMGGLIVRTHRQRDNGSQTSNEYQLLLAVSAPKTTQKCAEMAPDSVDKSVDSDGGGSAMVAPPPVPPWHPPSAMVAPLESSMNRNKPPMSPKKRGTAGSGAFEAWWAKYPVDRRFDKKRCWEIWRSRELDLDAGRVQVSLDLDLACEQWQRDQGRYIPHAVVWLRQERYMRSAKPAAQRPDARCDHCGGAVVAVLGHKRLCMKHYMEETENA